MSELLPSLQAQDIQTGLLDYLTTTFALADEDAQRALREFLEGSASGIFKGPYLRLRLPFQPAADGWQDALEWQVPFTPYGHQAAAFTRLSSRFLDSERPRPLPTLVTTGTGSGKTEAFLYPILDHIVRARRQGVTGTKALILYPMNALANDQAKRLTELLTSDPALDGVTAALYTGEGGPKRTKVTRAGLITERGVIRSDPPDILLTNYKMLDQLLLRHEDQAIWKKSSHSLQYLVLDEFHTYDGAQGTDVAMLLRRLGITLKSHWAEGDYSDAERSRPLGKMTPVATSATLGDKGDPGIMREFAGTVFGDEFDEASVVTESRMSLEEWVGDAEARVAARGLTAVPVTAAAVKALGDGRKGLAGADAEWQALAILGALWAPTPGSFPQEPSEALDLVKAHPFLQALARATTEAASLRDLAIDLLPDAPPPGVDPDAWLAARIDFLVDVAALLSHVRAGTASAAFPALSVDLHLWVRELTRVDRRASAAAGYVWSDDGPLAVDDSGDAYDNEHRPAYPALYCRHCGRSGWGITLAPTGTDLDTDIAAIRRNHLMKEGRFRALLFAPAEADRVAHPGDGEAIEISELRYWDVRQGTLVPSAPTPDDEGLLRGWILPVLTNVGPDADDDSRADVCPSCQQKDTIRFLGSAIATLLSVSLSTLFGSRNLDAREKKALVFTDSVQDAAHRAGFVESRSHALTLRSVLRDAVGTSPVNLEELVESVFTSAGDDRFKRHRLLPPDLVGRDEFSPFWRQATLRSVPAAVRKRVRRRLLFDAVLEFGLQSRVGRTLELTGSLVAEVDAGTSSKLASIGRAALAGADIQSLDDQAWKPGDTQLAQWVRGTLTHMRSQGGVDHEWLAKYLSSDGNRWAIWGGRPRGQGMPAFPRGRSAPEFPRVGKATPAIRDPLFVNVANAQSWYARWAARVLKVPTSASAALARTLFAQLAKADVVREVTTESGASVYAIPATSVLVSATDDAHLAAGRHTLKCTVCRNALPGTALVIAQMEGAPCILARCPGTLAREGSATNYYRELYASAAMRRIVAREHTSLLPDETRLAYESGFKESAERPDAPNVLVATPTLEMGIDIGDLSTVLLASLPKTVASYLQRVGRAGRLTGSALNLAFVTGRGDQLPRLGDPLSVINGEVRPPATFLNAEEILQRQYIAHLVDAFARDPNRPHPRLAPAVLGDSRGGTFLGDLIAYAEEGAPAHLARFLGTFSTLTKPTESALTAWATPHDGPSSSGLAAHLHGASLRWSATIAELQNRQKAIEAAIPALDEQAAHPAATEEQKRDAKAARAALKLTRGILGRLKKDYWINALEEFGVLPNYTLLDDSVSLDVGVTWIDPDSGEYHSDPISYSRGARNALREFAPGATFYAGGLEIEIDAVDLGIEGDSVRTWAFCPDCGYAKDLAEQGAIITVAQCPRCGSTGIADTSQQLEAVELTRVTAEVRRDEAAIADRSDERKRALFSMFLAADIDPRQVKSEWYVDGYEFGVRYLNRMTLRRINAGKQTAYGRPLRIGGYEAPAPMFRVCAGCGKLDRESGRNETYEHRTWCRYRNEREENNRTVVLTRTLTTQGVLFRLPLSVTLDGDLALPSLTAAILLGLRDRMGGAPDHIEIAYATDPHFGDEGSAPATALLLHDLVPGGTGYLADLAEPENVWSLLRRTWEVVRDCPCRDEERLSCHRCLLPFASPHNAHLISRAVAEQHLRAILTSGASLEAPDPGIDLEWKTTESPPGEPDVESHLEKMFSAAFSKALAAAGAKVTSTPGPGGIRLTIKISDTPRMWTLEPQVRMGGVQPDFVLRCNDTNIPDVVIFTDGHRYHASAAINRIADDAQKRAGLRDAGKVVLAITAPDVQAWTSDKTTPPVWLSDATTSSVLAQSSANFGPPTVEAIKGGPIAFLLSWIQDPKPAEIEAFSGIAPYYFATLPGVTHLVAPDGSSAIALAVAVAEGTTLPPNGGGVPNAWMWNADACVLAAREVPGGAVEVALVLDDRAEAVAADGHRAAWQAWLQVSNALNLRVQPTTILALSDAKLIAVESPSDSLVESLLPREWAALVELAATPVEHALLVALADLGTVRLPILGYETAAGLPLEVAWPHSLTVVDLGLAPADKAELEAEGWTILPPDPSAISDALREQGVR